MNPDTADKITALIESRTRAFEILRAIDTTLCDLFVPDARIPPLDSVPTLLLYRDHLKATIKAYEEREKALGVHIRDAIASNGLDRFENEDHIAQMMYPDDRETIVGAKLLLAGVSVETIKAATTYTEVTPFLRIDRRASKKAQ